MNDLHAERCMGLPLIITDGPIVENIGKQICNSQASVFFLTSAIKKAIFLLYVVTTLFDENISYSALIAAWRISNDVKRFVESVDGFTENFS